MKKREIYSSLRVLPPFIIRLDGRAFHQFCTACGFVRPYDDRFAGAMADVVVSIMEDSGLCPVFGYTFSDEISLYFNLVPFDGRIEKIDSVTASFASSSLTLLLNLKKPVSFDARIIPVTSDMVIPYLTGRQDEAWRNHINGWSQFLLMKEGFSSIEAAKQLRGIKSSEMHEICHQRGVNLAHTPAWQRRGILVKREVFLKEGFNPVTCTETTTYRRRIYIDRDLPLFSKPEGRKYIAMLVNNQESSHISK